MLESEPAYAQAVEDSRKIFVDPKALPDLSWLSDATDNYHERVRPVAQALVYNLQSITSSLSLPHETYTFAEVMCKKRYDTYSIYQHIGGRPDTDGAERRELLDHAFLEADAELKRMLEDPEASRDFETNIRVHLSVFGKNLSVLNGCQELLRQAVVSLWGAFEAMAKDLFMDLIEVKPSLVRRLKGEYLKQFNLEKMTVLEFLEKNDYALNIRPHMFLNPEKLDDDLTIKEVYKSLLPGAVALRDEANYITLRFLRARRNLIVHHCAIANDEYFRLVGDTKVGEKLLITPTQVYDDLLLIAKLGDDLLKVASHELVSNV